MKPYFIIFLFVTSAIISQSASTSEMKWNLNDVSYLFPLPDAGNSPPQTLLGPTNAKESGALLPTDLYGKLPTLLISGNGNQTLYQDALRVVAARIDPCPTLDAASCSPEIRLVWQPVEHDKTLKKWVARDAAVHCFYRLSNEDFKALLSELWDIKKATEKKGVSTNFEELYVHPALKNKQTAALFNQRIQQTLVQYIGGSNLEKITFISLMTPKRWWRFGAFEKDKNGQWHSVEIPRLEMTTEDIFNVVVNDGVGLGAEKGINAIFNVLPEEYPESDNIFTVINKSYRFNDKRDLPVFKEKLNAIARFQNPHNTNTENLDCASCHYADATEHYISNRFPELAKPAASEHFVNPDAEAFNLENVAHAVKSGRNVRAFGFLDDTPVISQRTINESALSAFWLNMYHAKGS